MKRALLCVLVAFSAAANPKLPGNAAYQRGDYAAAARDMKLALEAQKLSPEDAEATRMYLAAAYFALGDNASVENTLTELFRKSPEARLDAGVFDPDLVALSETVRAAETKRRAEELAAKQQQQAEQKAQAAVTPPPEEKPAELVEPVAPPPSRSDFQVRVGLFALSDVAGAPSASGALMLSGVVSGVEFGVRAFPGGWTDSEGEEHLAIAVGGELAYLLGDGAFHPRAGGRFTWYPALSDGATGTISGFGVGPVLGLRYDVASFLTLGADVSAEFNSVGSSERYRNLSSVVSAGAQLVF